MGLNTSPDTPDLEKIWSEGSVLVIGGPVSRPHEGHYVMLAILEPDMCVRYIRERSSTSTSRNCFMSFRTITI